MVSRIQDRLEVFTAAIQIEVVGLLTKVVKIFNQRHTDWSRVIHFESMAVTLQILYCSQKITEDALQDARCQPW